MSVPNTMTVMVKRILLASPRGYCAGVERAVDTVEQALDLWGPPVYVRKQIVHNAHVVRELEERGAIFVDSEMEIPPGSTVVFSAHGVAPAVHENARRLELKTIDATCPLVTKVHSEARHYAAQGYSILLIGHAGHEEVEGTMGEAPDSIILVESTDQAERLEPPRTDRLAYITQTTLSVDETNEIVDVLRRRFPHIVAPKKDDICYATTNRQRAVKAMLSEVDLLLVIGSRNSSNSNRLVEVARATGVPSYLIDDETEIDESWLHGTEIVGITSGASAPETLIRRVLAWFADRGVDDVRAHAEELEDVMFKLPVEIRRHAAA
jgi:4-hydroxy-3-methylbut-2-en-1-yl diphosphate reductase